MTVPDVTRQRERFRSILARRLAAAVETTIRDSERAGGPLTAEDVVQVMEDQARQMRDVVRR